MILTCYYNNRLYLGPYFVTAWMNTCDSHQRNQWFTLVTVAVFNLC